MLRAIYFRVIQKREKQPYSPKTDMWPVPQLHDSGASSMVPPMFSQLAQLPPLYARCQHCPSLADVTNPPLRPEPQLTVDGSFTMLPPRLVQLLQPPLEES